MRAMFARVAPRYDLLNHLLSFNLDRWWRRRAAGEVPDVPGARVLDLCCGTGDLAAAVLRRARGARLVGCDFSHPMLLRAAPKLRRLRMADRCDLVEADGLQLPFGDATFDAVTVGFGVRNLEDLDAGFREMLRVLRPGGRLVVLEFSVPEGPILGRLYRTYLHGLVPRAGGAYGYLARTVAEFPEAPLLAGRIREAGFAAVSWELLTGGIVAVHVAIR